MPNVLKSLTIGYIITSNPRNPRQIYKISLNPNDIKCIVWWSKDYSKWLEYYHNNTELFDKYKHMFNFTITGCDKLEPGVKSSLDDRLFQLEHLIGLFGVNSIKYRFDPIVYYKKNNIIKNNLKNFEYIMKYISNLNIKNVIIAFCLKYKTVNSRMVKHGLELIELSVKEKQKKLDVLLEITDKYNLIMEACCDSGITGYRNIGQSHCIDQEVIEKLIDSDLNKNKKDTGQRKECRCVVSRDVGSYFKCGHGCFYCYANPI